MHVLTLGPGGKLLGSRRLMPIDDDGGRYGASLAFSPNPAGAAQLLVGAPFARRAGRRASRRAERRALRQHVQPRLGPRDAVRCLHHRVRRLGGCDTGACRRRASECCGGAPWSCMRETRMCGWREASWDCHRTRASVGASQSSKTAGPWSRWAPPASTIARGGCNWFGLTTPAGPPRRRVAVPIIADADPRPALPGAPSGGATAPRPPSPVAVADCPRRPISRPAWGGRRVAAAPFLLSASRRCGGSSAWCILAAGTKPEPLAAAADRNARGRPTCSC